MMLFQCLEEDQTAILVTTDQEKLLEICRRGDIQPEDTRYRIFDGYSGWGAQQLDNELRHGGWLIWDIQAKQLFSEPDEMWQAAVRQIGREILAGGIDPSRIPEDPAFN
jgi:putative transcriptional regulator